MRLLAIVGLSAAVAGCGSSALSSAGGQATSSAVPAASAAAGTHASPTGGAPRAGAAASSPAPAGAASTGPGASNCATGVTAGLRAGALTGLEFTSATQGWAVGQNTILATSDGGAHWTQQLSGNLNLTSVDFVSAKNGWAVGTSSLLATTDGGAHWTRLAEPCQPIRSVHFLSPAAGFAVAAGPGTGGSDPALPVTGGQVLATSDGGRSWRPVTTPPNAQSVCFSDAQHGWLGADGLLYRTADGGANWTKVTSATGTAGAGSAAGMSVECASGGSAWGLWTGGNAAMSQSPHVGYFADASGAVPLFAEQYFQTPGTKPTAQAPGSNAGPFSAIDSQDAVFIDWCSACGAGTAPWELVSSTGKPLAKNSTIGSITEAEAASFHSAQAGWVAGTDTVLSDSGASKSQERIVGTTDGGRTWHVQWSGPWTS